MRGVRPHDAGARSALPSPQGQAPVQSGPAQVLRQAALQVHEQQLRQYAAAGAHIRKRRTKPYAFNLAENKVIIIRQK